MTASLATLTQMVSAISDLNSQLILLVASSNGGKTPLLRELGAKLHCEPLNVSLLLGRRLAAMPHHQRGFAVGELLRECAEQEGTTGPLLLDNLEILFEPSLQINPIDIIKRLAHARPVVAVWPGTVGDDRLLYAERSHPEHRDYRRDGMVIYELCSAMTNGSPA